YRLKPGWREDGVFMSMNSTIMTGIPVSRFQKLYKKKIDYNCYFTTAEISLRDKRITDYFISNISNESAEVRALSARALGQLRAADSVDQLIAMLGDRDYVAAKSALLSLGRIDEKWNGRPAVAGAIIELKKRFGEIDYDSGMAVYLIQSIGTIEAAAALNELFGYCDETLKAQILIGLADMPNGFAGKLAVKRFNGVSAINATYAMDGLKKEYPNWNKDTEVVSVIFEKLKPCVTGRDDVARIRSVDILSDIKAPFMRDFFVEAAGDTCEAVRSDAIYGLGRIGDTGSVSILIEMLDDTSEIVRGRVSKALDAIDRKWREGTAAVEFAGRMKKQAVSGPESEKMPAVAALGKMNNKNSWDIYLSAADFVDARKTATALSAMIAADETKASELVLGRLSKAVMRDCKLSVIGAYRESFSPENASSVKLLAGLWLDDNDDVACEARFAIKSRDLLKYSAASINAASKIALAAINIPDVQKKIRAIEMCGFFGIDSAFNKIAASLRDNDAKIRYAAAEALKGYPKDEAERKVFEIIHSDTSEQPAAYDFLTG
ncbi:MAG TPA: HEAT repeat domain-containing protein, partial [Candidatus Wallbacteria bacterium]|nr:HEAT repeat domain-containing protein [Candidatus Wallbacteria bacterium]